MTQDATGARSGPLAQQDTLLYPAARSGQVPFDCTLVLMPVEMLHKPHKDREKLSHYLAGKLARGMGRPVLGSGYGGIFVSLGRNEDPEPLKWSANAIVPIYGAAVIQHAPFTAPDSPGAAPSPVPGGPSK
jgi:hypothetical protein